MKTINSWSLSIVKPLKHPEHASLIGQLECGKWVRTSTINKIEGKKITTQSGSVYMLLDPGKDYFDFLEENNIEYSDSDPIVFKIN